MAVSVNQILANTLGLADPLGRVADDGRVGFNGRVNINGRPIRFASNFDGVDDYGALPYRAINPDGDIEVEWEQGDVPTAGVREIVAQSESTSFSSREFVLRWDSGLLTVTLGGALVISPADSITNAVGKWRFTISGTTVSVFRNNALVFTNPSRTRGAAREPAAITRIATRSSGGTLTGFFGGLLYNIRINGTLWRMADRNQAIQLPEPSGLGAELITPTVLENPFTKNNQWTYLSGGRWQYVGDGSFNVLQFISVSASPEAAFLEFEVESISGDMTAAISNSTANFNTVGVKRYFYTTKGVNDANIVQFKRRTGGVVASCIIKNISFKPLSVANSTELVTNGDFSAGTTGWLLNNGGTLSVSSGQGTLTTVAGQNSTLGQNFTVEAGAYYEVSCDLISFTGNTFAKLSLYRGAAGSFAYITETTATTAGKMRLILIAPATDLAVRIRGDNINAGTVVVDNVSIRKLDSLCNPMTLVNVTSDRWQEVPQ